MMHDILILRKHDILKCSRNCTEKAFGSTAIQTDSLLSIYITRTSDVQTYPIVMQVTLTKLAEPSIRCCLVRIFVISTKTMLLSLRTFFLENSTSVVAHNQNLSFAWPSCTQQGYRSWLFTHCIGNISQYFIAIFKGIRITIKLSPLYLLLNYYM